MHHPRPTLCLTLALSGLALLSACRPTPAPSPQPDTHPAPIDPRKASPQPAAMVAPLERFG